MTPIDELKSEHAAVKEALRILEVIADRASRGRVEHLADVPALLEFFKTFVDRCHHGKEEDLLFPELEAAGISRKGGPIEVMLAEHEHGRRHIAGMRGAIDGAGVLQDADAFARHAADYIRLLRGHIDKEDHVLFVVADKVLSDSAVQRLAEGFERIENERIGPGRHEAFHDLLARLGAQVAQ